jgi:hypothetical protein
METCVICLEEATEEQPLYLIACGCRGSWFHPSCEDSWISNHQHMPYSCPICRRYVPMLTNYSFSFWAGEEQQRLLLTLLAFTMNTLGLLYLSYSVYPYFYVLPIQQGLILIFPLLVPSWNTLAYYTFHVRTHVCVTSFFLSLGFLQSVEKREPIYSGTLMIGYLHILVVYILYVQESQMPAVLPPRDPFEPYAISREIIHSGFLIAQPPANPREGNKPRRATHREPRRRL